MLLLNPLCKQVFTFTFLFAMHRASFNHHIQNLNVQLCIPILCVAMSGGIMLVG